MSGQDISFLDALVRMEMAFAHLCEHLEILTKQNAELIDLLTGDVGGEGADGGGDPGAPTHDLAGKRITIR